MPITAATRRPSVGSIVRKHLVIGVVILVVILANGTGVRCSAETDPLQTVIQDFCHTNIPVSHAICLLAKRSPIPIDAVIDDTNDPPVTISVDKGTLAEVLQRLLPLHPGHHAHEQSDLILILPDGLLNKQVFPLTQKLTKFGITYVLPEPTIENRQPKVLCDFFPSDNPDLNVSIPVFWLGRKPSYSKFPYVRTFENHSILEILTTISSEQNMSFFCYRLDKDLVKAQNKAWADKKMPTWWPNPDAPCYTVFWGTGWYGVRGKE